MRKLILFFSALLVLTSSGISLYADEPGRNEKKGLGIAPNNYPNWDKTLKELGASWYYTWRAQEPGDSPQGIEFVPMVFGNERYIDSALRMVSKSNRDDFNYVLGFNEPDKKDQADMSVERALELWPKLMASGAPLISPAVANPDGPWLEKFMKIAEERGLRVDYIGVHHYGGSNPDEFLDRLERIHKKFDRPLWITEFGVGDWKVKSIKNNRHSEKDVQNFMKKVLPKLDRLRYVHRYAWFPATPDNPNLGTCALFDKNGNLTELGKIYAKHD